MSYIYKTKGTCSTQIEVELDGNIVKNVKFTGGCQGNLQAIPRLVEGMTVEEVERRISGIHCGMKNTSCGDQLAKALREAYDAQKMHNTITGLCKSLPRQICLGAFFIPVPPAATAFLPKLLKSSPAKVPFLPPSNLAFFHNYPARMAQNKYVSYSSAFQYS